MDGCGDLRTVCSAEVLVASHPSCRTVYGGQICWYSDAMLAYCSDGVTDPPPQEELTEYIEQLLGTTDWMSPCLDDLPAPAGAARTGGIRTAATAAARAAVPPRRSNPAQTAKDPPMSPAVGVLHRLRRSYTVGVTGIQAGESMQMMGPTAPAVRPLKRRSVDDLAALEQTPVPAPARRGSGGMRRSNSLPVHTPMSHASAVGQYGTFTADMPSSVPVDGAVDRHYYSGDRLPVWASARPPGAPPLIDSRGVPTWPMPPAPPSLAQSASLFKGVSRGPWSTRWDAHVLMPGGESVYCGSFDSEERAARAHDVAQLNLLGVPAGQQRCNFALNEYPGVEELERMPVPDFLAALRASAVEGSERRYSKYRGVYRDRNAVKGNIERWESRLEEAPDGVNTNGGGASGSGDGSG